MNNMLDENIIEIIKKIELKYNIAVDNNTVTAVRYIVFKDEKTCSLTLGNNTFLRTKRMKETYRLYIKKSVFDELSISPFVEIKELLSEPDFITLNFTEKSDEYYDIVEYCVNSAVKYFQPLNVFMCCSLYNACSDKKKCIHRDRLYAKGCWYRKNLEKGKIFYGKNKNC